MFPPTGELRFVRWPNETLWFQTGLVVPLMTFVRFTPSALICLPPRSTSRMSALGFDTPPFSVPSRPAASTTSTSSILRASMPTGGAAGSPAGLGIRSAASDDLGPAEEEEEEEGPPRPAAARLPLPACPRPGVPLVARVGASASAAAPCLRLPRLAGVPFPAGRAGLLRATLLFTAGVEGLAESPCCIPGVGPPFAAQILTGAGAAAAAGGRDLTAPPD